MEITQIICPACGGSITVDENGGAKCDYCGAMLNLDYMQDSHKDEIDALTDRIYDLIAEKRYIEAEEATKEGLKKIPYAGRLHLCLLMCELNVNHPQQLATVERNYLSSTNYRNCIKYMTTTDKADLQSLADANNFNKMQTIEPQMPTMNPVAASTTPVTPTIPFYPIAPVTAQTPATPNHVAPNSVESTTPTANLNHRVDEYDDRDDEYDDRDDEYDDRDDDDSTENRHKTTNETNAPKTKGYKFIQALLTLTAVCWLPIIFSIVHIALCPDSVGIFFVGGFLIIMCLILYCVEMPMIFKNKLYKECRKCKTPLTANDCRSIDFVEDQTINNNRVVSIYQFDCVCPNCGTEKSFTQKFTTATQDKQGNIKETNGFTLARNFMNSKPIFAKKTHKIIGIVWSAVFAVLTIVVGAVVGAGMNSGTTTKSSGKSVDPCDYYGTYYAYYKGQIATVVINENQFIVNYDEGINNVQRGISEGVDGEYDYKFYTSKDFEKKVGYQSYGYDVLYDNFRRCALYFTSTSHDTIMFDPSSSSAPKLTKTPITWESIFGTPKTSYFGTYKSSDGSIVKIGLNDAYIDKTKYNWFYANGEYVNQHFSTSYSKTKEFFIIYDPNKNSNFIFEIGTNSLKKNNITFEKDTSVDSLIYTVTYYLNGGTNNEDNPTLIDSDTIFTLKNPTKTGYTFDGWYKESTFQTKVTRISSPTGDMSLYAKWSSSSSGGGSTPKSYTITYVLNGGTNSSSNVSSAKSGSTVTLYSPSKNGYSFDGWYDENYSSKQTKITNISADVTLYAKWSFNATTSSLNFVKQNGGGIEYYEVSAKSSTATSLAIPSTYNGLPVCIAADGFYNMTSLKSVVLEDVTSNEISNKLMASIGSSAFYGCKNLSTVTIGNGWGGIESNAFYGCTSLKSITIPESVCYIDGNAFKNSGLTTATFKYVKNWYAFTEDDLNGNYYTFPSSKLATYLNNETDEYTLAECLTYYYRDKLLINKTKTYEIMI